MSGGRPPNLVARDLAMRLAVQGLSIRAIARVLDVSSSIVHKWLRYDGYQPARTVPDIINMLPPTLARDVTEYRTTRIPPAPVAIPRAHLITDTDYHKVLA